MRIPKPGFELARVYSDGTKEVEIVAVTDIPLDTTTGRRGFLATALTAAALLGITGCTKRNSVATSAKESAPNAAVTKDVDCEELASHTELIWALAISPDGSTVVSGSDDKTIKLWELATGTLRHILTDHTERIRALIINPDGHTLVSSSDDKTIKLWELSTGALHQNLESHTGAIEALAISPDGRTLASGSYDKTIKLWNPLEGALRLTLESHTGAIEALAISPDGRTLVSGGGRGNIILWDLPSGALRQTLKGHTNAIHALAISPDGSILASAGWDQIIKLWDLPSGQFKRCLFDLKATPLNTKGMTYQGRNQYGQIITYTLPCGSPIPPGATCTCNCVPGTYSIPAPYGPGGSAPCGSPIPPGATCTCNCVCTCLAV